MAWLDELTQNHLVVGTIYGVLSAIYVTSMKLTTAANAIVLIYTVPIWVGLLAPVILKERVGGKDWLFMGAMFTGVILFFLDGLSTEDLLGNCLALTGGLLFAFQVIFFRKLSGADPVNAVILGNLIAFVIGLPAWGSPWPGLLGWFFIVGLGIFQLGVLYYLYALMG